MSDPFGEDECSWSFNYFFYNKKMKKIVFISCRAARLVFSVVTLLQIKTFSIRACCSSLGLVTSPSDPNMNFEMSWEGSGELDDSSGYDANSSGRLVTVCIRRLLFIVEMNFLFLF